MKFTPLKSSSTVCSVAGLYRLGVLRTVLGLIFGAMASGAALRADITAASSRPTNDRSAHDWESR